MSAVCSRCGKEIKGEDQKRLSEYQENARLMEARVREMRIPIPVTINENRNFKNALFYCKECIAQIGTWQKEDKHCNNCDFLLMNFMRMPGIPDIYCRKHGNKTVYDPQKETCKDWDLQNTLKK